MLRTLNAPTAPASPLGPVTPTPIGPATPSAPTGPSGPAGPEGPAIAHEGDGHSGAFAYALDGYAIHTMLNTNGEEKTDLDNCRGHVDTIRGYHYHVPGPGENAFISCFTGEIAQGFGGQQGPPPRGQGAIQRLDLRMVGLTSQKLRQYWESLKILSETLWGLHFQIGLLLLSFLG